MNVSYREALAHTVNEIGLSEPNWKAEGWKNLGALVTQGDLNDAFNQHSRLAQIFSELGEMETRACKKLERVKTKMTEQPPGKENYFKVSADFVAVRIPCKVPVIKEKIEKLKEIAFAHHAQIFIRGSSNEQPYGFCIAPDGKYKDITQYVYLYLEEIGYIIEFQIGHPFAGHTFTIDSALRDDKNCGKVDLWPSGFYEKVNKYLLDKANHEPSEPKSTLSAQAAAIHAGVIPEDLRAILDNMD